MTPDVLKPKQVRNVIALPYWIAEFALIRTAALTMLAALVISATGVLVTEWHANQATAQMEQLQRVRDAAYSRYAQVDQEKQDIRRFQPYYVALQRRGLVGEERRLEWVDAIRQAQQGLQLPPLSYDIDPQQPVRLETPLDLGSLQLHASRMRLHMDLLHELDLFNFFDELRQRGYYALQDCSIKRLAQTAAVSSAPALSADCTLQWVTLNRASASRRAGP